METRQTQIRRASLGREELEARQQPASTHRAGHYAGFHPEDTPYLTGNGRVSHSASTRPVLQRVTTADEIDDDRLYQTRPKTSVRVYNRPKPPAIGYKPPPTQIAEEAAEKSIIIRRFLLACFLITFIGVLIAMFINLFALPSLGRWNDERMYGYPRTIKATANVGHGDKQHPLSQFIAINTGGVIDVVELSYGNESQKTAHVYVITALVGENANLVPVTSIAFQDENGDGKPDLEIVVNNTLYILYNTGTAFAPRQ